MPGSRGREMAYNRGNKSKLRYSLVEIYQECQFNQSSARIMNLCKAGLLQER
jgi:hypothetical protein